MACVLFTQVSHSLVWLQLLKLASQLFGASENRVELLILHAELSNPHCFCFQFGLGLFLLLFSSDVAYTLENFTCVFDI